MHSNNASNDNDRILKQLLATVIREVLGQYLWQALVNYDIFIAFVLSLLLLNRDLDGLIGAHLRQVEHSLVWAL